MAGSAEVLIEPGIGQKAFGEWLDRRRTDGGKLHEWVFRTMGGMLELDGQPERFTCRKPTMMMPMIGKSARRFTRQQSVIRSSMDVTGRSVAVIGFRMDMHERDGEHPDRQPTNDQTDAPASFMSTAGHDQRHIGKKRATIKLAGRSAWRSFVFRRYESGATMAEPPRLETV